MISIATLIAVMVLGAGDRGAHADEASQTGPAPICANVDGHTPAAARVAACSTLLRAEGLTADQQSMILDDRAWSLSLLGKMADARADYERALALSPNSHVAHNEFALFELRTGQLDAAIAEYDVALRLRPDAPYSLYGRGLALIRKGQSQIGQDDLAKARLGDSHVDDVFLTIGLRP
jgi:lipoprotein NlpI